MLKSDSSPSKWNLRTLTARIPFLRVLAAFLVLLPAAFAQDFTLSDSPFFPTAVTPGGTASSNISVGTTGNFTGDVTLSCQVSPPSDATITAPTCTMSPPTVTPPAGSAAVITTNATSTAPAATPGLYSVAITGTGPSTTHSLAPLNITVLSVSAQFTVTVAAAVVPSSVPAGSGAQGTINVNPLDGYSGIVTLACRSITPLVTIPPICSFNPPTVTVNGNTESSTINITTQGLAVPTGAVAHPRTFYALWLPLPMLALIGFGAASSRKGTRKVWGVLGLFIVAAALMLTPACGNSTPTTNPNGVTPNNTYTFTLIGVDTNGVTSSNTGTGGTTTNPTVSLTVTTAPKP
jgi:hypothetical protein